MTRRLCTRVSGAVALAAIALVLAGPSPAGAHDPRAEARPAALQGVAFDQRVNAPVPLEATFRDETGRAVRLGDYFETRPVVLALVYHRCRELCPLLLEGATRALRALPFTPGRAYDLVVLSFDPRDTPAIAAARKAELIQRSGMSGAAAGWHFLTGEAPAIRAVTEAVGFRYSYDAKADQFAHASGLVLLTPRGTIFRYMYGIEFPPEILRLGLVEASQGRVGSVVDQVLLFCYHYDPSTGTYTLAIMNVLRAAGLTTVGAMAAFIVLMRRRDRRRRRMPVGGV